MNSSEEQLNMLKQFLTLAGGILATMGIMSVTQETTLVTDLMIGIPALVSAGSILWSLASHWGKKKVPDNSTAVILPSSVAVPPVGGSINLTPVQGVAKVVGALLIGFLILQAAPAMAQTKTTAKLSTSGVPCDPLSLIPGCTPKTAAAKSAAAAASPTIADSLATFMTQLDTIQAATVAGVVGDMQAADADAATIITPAAGTTPAAVKDPISHACYPAAIQFLQSLPTSTPTTGQFVVVQLFQKKRDFIAQVQAGLPVYLKLGCAPLLGDEANIFISLMNSVGLKIAPLALTAIMPALAPITLPALALTP